MRTWDATRVRRVLLERAQPDSPSRVRVSMSGASAKIYLDWNYEPSENTQEFAGGLVGRCTDGHAWRICVS